MEKPSIPKGTRDFGPAQMAKRQFIFDNIKKVFQKYGFQPLETPAMENLTTLTGKYGEEGDQLLFKVLNSGDYFKPIKGLLNFPEADQKIVKEFFESICEHVYDLNPPDGYKNLEEIMDSIQVSHDELIKEVKNEQLKSLISDYIIDQLSSVAFSLSSWLRKRTEDLREEAINEINSKIAEYFVFQKLGNVDSKEITKEISEKGLRYDLTVPFARYVVMNRHEITFPFKRYQIQPVWRADRPQKGRYREFYQCDADVVGTDSLICEADIVLMIKEVFQSLGILDYTIKINHRGVLAGMANMLGTSEKHNDFFSAIDKLEKIGEQKVREELVSKGFSERNLDLLFDSFFGYRGNDKINYLRNRFEFSDDGLRGISDLENVFSYLNSYGSNMDHIEFDISLARGLSYYTGCIFEVKINNVAIGSVSGGGRYDNLTGVFGLPDVSGVGISFGVDRLYDAMEELKCFPEETQISSKVMIAHFDESNFNYSLGIAHQLRNKGIATEVYPEVTKIKKQLDYANKKMIPFVIVIGSDEQKSGLLSFKDMKKGEQQQIDLESIIKLFVNSN